MLLLIRALFNEKHKYTKRKPIPLIQWIMFQFRTGIFSLLCIYFCGNSYAQSGNQLVRFHPIWLGVPVSGNQQFNAREGFDSLRFSTLRFYVSELTLIQENQNPLKDPQRAHLIDVFDSTRNQIAMEKFSSGESTTICFTLGLDSTLNTSGILEGDLDPVEDMYWTWQSGFIHFKLEGECALADNAGINFEYHLGGYRSPFATSKEICLHSERPKREWNIALALDRFLDPALVSEKPRLMSPGADALRLTVRASSIFELIDKP